MGASGSGGAPECVVAFDTLPIAALLLRGDHIVAVNAAYEEFMGAPAAAIVGRTVSHLIGQFVGTADESLVGAAAEAQRSGAGPDGKLWISVVDFRGRQRSIRVDWHPLDGGEQSVVYLIDAEGETAARSAAEGLARAAGQLGLCKDEREILERAADVLHGRGLIVTTLLLTGAPLLEYGPMRGPKGPDGKASAISEQVRAVRPRREVLWELNKEFHQRRVAFFQDAAPLAAAAYPGPLGESLKAFMPQRRTVQAPLFVNDEPYGALVLTGDHLTPALAGSIEMFAELVARAIENVRLRTELVQRGRLAALGEAAAVMAHEVRNPVTAILNAGALLSRAPIDAAAQASLVQVIAEEARRLDQLVGDLLDLGRPLTPRLHAVNLRDVTERSVRVLATRGQASAAPIVVQSPETPVLARIDPDLVQLALCNVVRNAVQASPAGKSVTVTIEARQSRAAVVIDDEGPGFPSEQVQRVLEPFHTTRATGTGIGLAVVRRVVEACRGSLEIGANPGRGGRVVLVFPCADEG